MVLTDTDVAKMLDGYLKSDYLKSVKLIPKEKINCGFTNILAGLQNISPSYKVRHLWRMMAAHLCQNVKELEPRIHAYIVSLKRSIRELCEVMLSEEMGADLVWLPLSYGIISCLHQILVVCYNILYVHYFSVICSKAWVVCIPILHVQYLSVVSNLPPGINALYNKNIVPLYICTVKMRPFGYTWHFFSDCTQWCITFCANKESQEALRAFHCEKLTNVTFSILMLICNWVSG